MVIPIANTGTGAVDAQRVASKGLGKPVSHGAEKAVAPSQAPAARLASLGPPIDMTRVNEIRAAIADGTYTVDADRLAAAMLALDLPGTVK